VSEASQSKPTLHLRGKARTLEEANALAVTEMKRGNLQGAVDIFTLILAKAPHPIIFLNRGLAMQGMEKHDSALADFDQAIALDPNYGPTFNSRGITLHRLKRYHEALTSYDRAIAINPNDSAAYTNRGMTLHALDRYQESLISCKQAVNVTPGQPVFHNNLGNALQEMGQFEEALVCYDKATEISPDYAEAHWNAAVVRLTLGDLDRGWRQAESRWKHRGLGKEIRQFHQPLWLGQPIGGQTILVYSEQGMGDIIQFCRYVPVLAERGAKVILEVDAVLTQLLSGLEGVSSCVTRHTPHPPFDVQCPILTLPLAFATQLKSIPATVPYLTVPTGGRDWQKLLGPKTRPRIGIAWSGNPNHVHDRKRSVALEALLPLLDFDATFISLQKDVRASDAPILQQRNDILNYGPELTDFADTAALISCLDLVISVDTSVVHLAGALAKPVWVLIPYLPDWRWLLNREDSPWYPTARLFRQSAARDWKEVVANISLALQNSAFQ
jgi:Flp pilus assembly protein TadD